ncbi:MAG: hypothetical protein LW850_04400 [Planctomycetaceae bacterium]|nr:hypothetical protein [Planctomycetaceae bacterium]
MKLHNRLIQLLSMVLWLMGSVGTAQETIKHSYLVLGAKTAIIAEDGKVVWEHAGGSRDGFVLQSKRAFGLFQSG